MRGLRLHCSLRGRATAKASTRARARGARARGARARAKALWVAWAARASMSHKVIKARAKARTSWYQCTSRSCMPSLGACGFAADS